MICNVFRSFLLERSLINARWLNTSILMIAVVLIGYSSYAAIVIRSSAKPTMDQNAPDNVFCAEILPEP